MQTVPEKKFLPPVDLRNLHVMTKFSICRRHTLTENGLKTCLIILNLKKPIFRPVGVSLYAYHDMAGKT